MDRDDEPRTGDLTPTNAPECDDGSAATAPAESVDDGLPDDPAPVAAESGGDADLDSEGDAAGDPDPDPDPDPDSGGARDAADDRPVAEPFVAEPAVVTPDAVEPMPALGTVEPAGPRVARRHVRFRRGAAVGGLAVVVALAVSAFATVTPSTVTADQHFVDLARSQGRLIAAGGQQALVISAARKICDRRESHGTVAQRKATALSIPELAAVEQTFSHDARSFTTLALDTYCSR